MIYLAVDVYGTLWLTEAFAPLLRRSAPARVVNVASYWAGNLDLTDVEFRRRPYRNGTAYRLGFGGSQSPDEGARTPVWLAADSTVAGVTGQYFEQRRATPCRFATDRAAIEQLVQLCGQY